MYAQTSPYPQSTFVTGVNFDITTQRSEATGSDNWPITWADDGHQYASWGDGGGFGGDNTLGRVSLGFARLEGDKTNYTGFNVWGGLNPENPSQFGGKSYGIISINGVLYAWWGPGNNATSYNETRLLKSTDKGAIWEQSAWDFISLDDRLIMPTILNFGQDYAGARDNYVYHYFIYKQGTPTNLTVHQPGIVYLARVDKNLIPNTSDPNNINSYEFFAGLDGGGNPTWGDVASKQPVFQDANGVGWNLSVSYNQGLDRYILMTEHTQSFQGNMGMFEASEPWGPWSTVDYFNN